MDIRKLIDKLEQNGELLRISTKVDTRFELCEITDRISKQAGGGKAILFENNGTDYPVLMNAMGSDRRMAWALDVENLDETKSRQRSG